MTPLLTVPYVPRLSTVQQGAAPPEALMGLRGGRSHSSDCQGSGSSSPSTGGLINSCGSVGGMQAPIHVRPVFSLGGKFYNARGEEVELPRVYRCVHLRMHAQGILLPQKQVLALLVR